jgi:hypothetical protein
VSRPSLLRLEQLAESAEAYRDACLGARRQERAELARSDAELAEAAAAELAASIRARTPLTAEARAARELADRACAAAQACRDHQHAQAYRARRAAP